MRGEGTAEATADAAMHDELAWMREQIGLDPITPAEQHRTAEQERLTTEGPQDGDILMTLGATDEAPTIMASIFEEVHDPQAEAIMARMRAKAERERAEQG